MVGVHRQEGRAILTRIATPGLALFAVIVVIGLLLTPPGIAIHTSEDSISAALEGARTDTWNTITLAWSLEKRDSTNIRNGTRPRHLSR